METELTLVGAPQQPPTAEQCGFDFPSGLTEKYQPRNLESFVGLEKIRKIAANLITRPRSSAWVFTGPSGTGKTVMGLVIAALIPAELHHIASKDCTLETVSTVAARCHTYPHDAWDITRACKMHLVLVDEADQMSSSAQVAFLSLLDATEFPPNTIFIFTCNSTARLEARFLSRCHVLEFSSYGIAPQTADLLRSIWRKECAVPNAPEPNFARIVKDASNNVREALNALETELMCA